MRREPEPLPNTVVQAGHSIRRIRIDKLFGRYTYDLKCKAPESVSSKLLILYGDNGSGKTTILRLVFNLLSHIDKRGHKSYLAKTRFRKLVVELGRNTQVVASRKGTSIIGSYTAYVRRRGRTLSSVHFSTDKDNDIVRVTDPKLRPRHERRVVHFLNALADLRLAIFFVTDDRQLLQNVAPVPDEFATSRGRTDRRPIRSGTEIRLRGRYLDAALARAITYAVQWAREQVLSGSKQGEADANTIYADIVRRLAGASAGVRTAERTNIKRLISTLEEQAARSVEFAKFGLPSALNIHDLVRSLARAHSDLGTIYKIVDPFVDTTKAKLDALQELQNSLSGFVDTLNSFFKDKKVAFDLRAGVTVTAAGGTELEPSDLSSGEKQLLLLFCNTLTTKDEETIFLIDEPEISLNIKWQRNLIRRLIDSTIKRKVQFVLATHSFELFAPHQSNVMELVDHRHAISQQSTTPNASGVGGGAQV